MKICHFPIFFEEDLCTSPSFLKVLKNFSRRVALITEETVASLYADSFLNSIDREGYDCSLITFKGGERSKTRKTKEGIENALLSKNFGKDTLLIVMGGGVTTDLGGFVAATYFRGLPYLSIPTTLLGMVDASIGGKTGVNTKEGKNLIGAFYPPVALFIDIALLSTLPDEGMLCGSAEVLKYALISNKHLFKELEEKPEEWKSRNPSFLRRVITQSIKIKQRILKKDPMDTGMRRSLNFGHTIGHAIETLEESSLPHGEALAIGMLVEAFIAKEMGHLNRSDFQALYSLLQEMGFSLTLSDRVTSLSMKQAMILDKKSEKARPRFVVLNGIGGVHRYRGSYCTWIEETILEEALGWMLEAFHR